jgi:hypothetical protein
MKVFADDKVERRDSHFGPNLMAVVDQMRGRGEQNGYPAVNTLLAIHAMTLTLAAQELIGRADRAPFSPVAGWRRCRLPTSDGIVERRNDSFTTVHLSKIVLTFCIGINRAATAAAYRGTRFI